MKAILSLEYGAFFILALYMFYVTGFSWWWFLALFFAPDISMLGYLINTKTGAFCYNIFHHFAIAFFIIVLGLYLNLPILNMIGSVLLAHSAFDRILGYGLKYSDSFQNTHLGKIGKQKT